jgi:hypothetical protein
VGREDCREKFSLTDQRDIDLNQEQADGGMAEIYIAGLPR